MARSFLYTNALSWEGVFLGAYETASTSDTYVVLYKMINGAERGIVYSGRALLSDRPIIDQVSVRDWQTDTELARIVRYWDGENDHDITRSVQALQSGGLDSFEHLMAGPLGGVQIGSEQVDIMTALASANDVNGGVGNDTLISSAGGDWLSGNEDFDYASYETASAGVFVNFAGHTHLNTGEAFGDRFHNTEGLIGSAYDDHFIGDRNGNYLLGGNGNDTLRGNYYPVVDPWDSGEDTLDGGWGIDTAQFLFNRADYDIIDAGGGYWLVSNRSFERDVALITNIEFLQFADQIIAAPIGPGPIFGTPDADRLTGTTGADTMYGHGRDSTTDTGDTLDGAGGNDTIYGGDGGDSIYGGAESDHLYGDEGNDRLYGGNADGVDTSADTLTGGNGSDVYYVYGSDTVVESSADNGQDEVHTSESFTLGLGQAVELLLAEAGTKEINLTGNALGQTLVGNAGDNRLNGGDGQDTLRGRGGNDTYVVVEDDTIDETIDVDGRKVDAGGIDTIETTISYGLSDYLENLILDGTAAINGVGNGLTNTITGNAAANSLSGAGGNDMLMGNGGADTLDGGAGTDQLSGGTGDDTYVIDENDTILELAGEGTDTVRSTQSYTLGANLENLTLLGTAAAGTGNGLDNTIIGNGSANTLDGGNGVDTVVFSGERSRYKVTLNADASVTITDLRTTGGDGSDTVRNTENFRFSDRTLNLKALLDVDPSDLSLEERKVFENSRTGDKIGTVKVVDNAGDTHRFELTDNADGRFSIDADTGEIKVADGVRLDYEQAQTHTIAVKVTDSQRASVTKPIVIEVQDQLTENATGNALGNLMLGGNGQDTFSGGAGNDTINAGAGNDRLNGDAGDDSLTGGAGNDVFSGSDGNDRLVGGFGKDTFTGGKGRDVFVFDDRDTGSSKTKADTITDFSGRGGDRIDLKAVDADTKKRGDQKFSFIGDEESFSKAGEVRYEKTKSATYVYLNTDNDKAAEAVIKLKGSIDLSKGWFVL